MPVVPSRNQAEILQLLARNGPSGLADYHARSVQVCWDRGWVAKHGPSAWFRRGRGVQRYHITDAGHEALARYRRATADGEGNDAATPAPPTRL